MFYGIRREVRLPSRTAHERECGYLKWTKTSTKTRSRIPHTRVPQRGTFTSKKRSKKRNPEVQDFSHSSVFSDISVLTGTFSESFPNVTSGLKWDRVTHGGLVKKEGRIFFPALTSQPFVLSINPGSLSFCV